MSTTDFNQYYLGDKAIIMPFHDDEKEGLPVRSSTPCELELDSDERCCHHRRGGKRIRRLIEILAILGVMFIGYKALVKCVLLRYKVRHELSEVCACSTTFFYE